MVTIGKRLETWSEDEFQVYGSYEVTTEVGVHSVGIMLGVPDYAIADVKASLASRGGTIPNAYITAWYADSSDWQQSTLDPVPSDYAAEIEEEFKRRAAKLWYGYESQSR